MLHRRHLAVQPDVDARRCERAVGLALRDGEDRRAGLELAAVRGRVGHHRGLRRYQDLLLAALVLHAHDAVVRHLHDVGDVRVGHLAVGPQIPIVMPFPGAAHVLGKDVDLLGDQRAFALAHGGGADDLAAGDVVGARLRDPHHHEVVGELHFHALAVAGLHGQDLAVERLDRAANPHRRVGRRLGGGDGGEGCEQDCGDGTDHGGLLFDDGPANAATREYIPPMFKIVVEWLDEDRSRARFALPGRQEWTAENIGALMQVLAQIREEMAPAVPSDPPRLHDLQAPHDPRYATQLHEFSGGTVLRFRQPSLGWLEFLLPSLEREKMTGYFEAQEAEWHHWHR